MTELLQGRNMTPDGQVCETTTCEQVRGVFERFYATLPNEEARDRFIQAKFEGFRSTLPSQGINCEGNICLPLLEIISKVNHE